MKKKIISFILSAFLVLSPAALVTAEGGAQPTVEVQVDVQTVSVSLNTPETFTNNDLTLKVFRLKDGKVEGNPVYYGQLENKTPETVTNDEETTKVYKYKFNDFNFLGSETSGMFRAIVNNTYSYDFAYATRGDKIKFYNDLLDAESTEIYDLIKKASEEGKTDIDFTDYLAMEETDREIVDGDIATIEYTALAEDASDEDIIAVENIIKADMQIFAQGALVYNAKTAEDFDTLLKSDSVKLLDLDLDYYKDKKLNLDKKDVFEKFGEEKTASFSKEGINKSLGGAVVMAAFEKPCDFNTLTELLEYYDDVAFTLDKTDSKNFTGAQKNKVSRKLLEDAENIKSLKELVKAYADAAEEVADEADTGSDIGTGTGTGSGGTGIGGGASSVGGSSNKHNSASGSGSVGTSQTAPVSFSDINEVSWATNAITYLAQNGVVNGKSAGKFCPQDVVTREEFVKMIVEGFKIYNANATVNFEDVSSDRWSYAYIASGVRAGIINGVSETEFAPANKITRQDMAVIMYRMAKVANINLNAGNLNFADSASIADYAKEAVAALSGSGIVNGMGDNTFAANGDVTRAQAAKVIYEMIILMGGAR